MKMKVNPKNKYEIKAFIQNPMKTTSYIIATIFCLSVFSCKKDDGKSCTICSSTITLDFEVCEERNGNASVNGQDTGTNYATYISGLEATGASCGN